jgi:hypothetical protein
MSKPSRLTRLHALAVTVLVLSLLPTPTSRASAPPPRPPVVLASASPLRWKLEQRVGASRLAW